MKLSGKAILITDGSSSLGRYLAAELAAAGGLIALNCPCGIDCEDHMQSDSVLVTHSDLLSSREVDEVFRRVIDRYGKIDALIHNHNLVMRKSIEECDEETFHKAMDWNTKTAFFCTQTAGRYMQKGGRILYLSSIHDEKPTGCAFTYSISKGAVKMLCRESAVVLGRRGIRSNLIEIGAGRDDDKVFESDLSNLYSYYEYKIPIDSYVTNQDIANLVRFLCSDESAAINGADIRLDGGHILNYFGFNKPISKVEGR